MNTADYQPHLSPILLPVLYKHFMLSFHQMMVIFDLRKRKSLWYNQDEIIEYTHKIFDVEVLWLRPSSVEHKTVKTILAFSSNLKSSMGRGGKILRLLEIREPAKPRAMDLLVFLPHQILWDMKEMIGKYVGNRSIKLRKSTWTERTDHKALGRHKNQSYKKAEQPKKSILHK
ncbi:hypothetical protein BUALT_Bualt01G0008300 [Buddleja alternifolia]|uniref:Ribosomal protein S3 n=1 Tax=Buddleja alternifolia TaxID=168488 RepID=A0AAV6YBE3_9LAMI|nr:hypothetical protein BUALT_Bualt01G0008300 [Buddleja alternifolia]